VVQPQPDEAALAPRARPEELKVLVDGDGVQYVRHVDAARGDDLGAAFGGAVGQLRELVLAQHHAQLVGVVEDLAVYLGGWEGEGWMPDVRVGWGGGGGRVHAAPSAQRVASTAHRVALHKSGSI